MNENKEEIENLFQLIESWDENNIKIALQVVKGNDELKNVMEKRYRPLLNFVGVKSFQSLRTLPKKLNSPKILSKNWKPDENSIQVLKSIPIYEINLENKSLTKFPIWICYLTQLTVLNLGNADGWWYKNKNKIKSIPADIRNLSNLKELRLARAELKNVSKGITELSQLQVLDLHYNNIQELPNLENLSQLININLFLNKLKEINGLEKLTQLQVLNLAANSIKEIRDVFDNLSELQELSLANNRLKILHNSICFLEKLWKLDIYDLPIKGKSPPNFANLKHLQFLRIDGTGTKKLPNFLKDFKKLTILRVQVKGFYYELDNQEEINAFLKKHLEE